MSGLRNSGGDVKYLTTFKGSFRLKTTSDNPKAVSREISKGPNTGKTVWELVYNTFTGHLVGIEKKEGEYDPQWAITFNADGKLFIINFYYASGFTNGLFLRLPNIDLAKEVTLHGHWFEEKGKAVLTVTQAGKKIDKYWTKEDPKKLPQMTQVPDPRIPDKFVWNSASQMAYLERYIEKSVGPRLEEAKDKLVMDTPMDQKNADDQPPPSEPDELIPEPGADITPTDITAEDVAAETKRQTEEDDDLPFIFNIPILLGLLAQWIM